ncbi:MAG TPA: hypothetical protein VIN61_00195 [Gammaproteobacteria bacterium]
MWRKTISGAAAALAVWTVSASPAAAHGWLFKLHGWPFAPNWGAPRLVSAGENGVSKPGVNDGCPIETADGLSLVFASSRDGDPNDIWAADRARIGDAWSEPRRLDPPISSPAGDFCPTPVRGRSLLFVSTRPGACPGEQPGGGDIYLSRQSPAGGWSEPVHLGCAPDGPNTTGGERSPSLVETPYGTFLFYSSNGNPTDGTVGPNQDIYVSVMRKDGTFGPGRLIPALSTPDFNDIMPNVRERPEGGYEMVFSSDRTSSPLGPAPKGAQDVYMSFAWFLPGPWTPPVNLGAVNTEAVEQRATLSHDGKRLYFGRVPAGGTSDIYVSERQRDER